jgi:PAS domain S-box-containing protein
MYSNDLLSYIQFLLTNRLDQLAAEIISEAKLLQLPLLKLLSDYSEEKLFEVSKTSVMSLLNGILDGTVLQRAKETGKLWKEDKLEDIPTQETSLKDFLLTPHVRKKALIKQIPFFTTELNVYQNIVIELDVVFTQLMEINFEDYIEVQETKSRLQNNRFTEKDKILKGLLSYLPVILTKIDDSGIIIESTGKGLEAIGLTENQQVGTSILENPHAPNTQTAFKDQKTSIFEAKFGKPGRERNFINYFFPNNNGLIGFSLDVTDQKTVEKDLQEKNYELSAVIEKLQATENNLLHLNKSLEKIVGKRTSELQLSENFLSNIIDQSPVSTWISDDAGYQIRVNKACLDLFEIKDPAVGIQKYNILKDPVLMNQVFYEDIVKVFTEGKVTSFTVDYDLSKVGLEGEILRKPLVLKVTIFPIKNEQGKITNAVIQHEDITEKHKAMLELEKSRDELQLLTDSLPLLISYVDREERYRFNNKAYEDWFGVPKADNYGKKIIEVLGKAAYENVKDYVREALAGEVITFETTMPYSTAEERYVISSYVPHRENGNVKGFYAVVRDITAKKKLEEEIKANKQMLDKIFMEAPALIALLDGKEQRYMMVNPPCLNIFRNRQLVGKTFREAHPEFAEQKMWDVMDGVYRTKKTAIFREKMVYIDRENDGKLVPGFFNLVLQPILQKENELEAVMIFALEVSEEIKGRQKLEVLAKELAQAYAISERKNQELLRMNQVLDNFVYSAAHDLRAPVSNLKGLVNLFAHPNSKLSQEKFLKETKTSLDRLDNTIVGLVEVIEIQNKTEDILKVVNFQEVFDLLVKEFSPEIDKDKMVLQTDFYRAPTIKYIEVYLNSIMRNLLSNAIKYKADDRDLEIRVSTYKEDGYIVLSMSDNGIGMDLEKYGKNLFKPFTRFNKKVEGKGIGLHLIKNMVERNGGFVQVESEVNVGTKFKFYLAEYS